MTVQCTMYFSKLFKIVTAVLKSSFFIGYIVMIKETMDSKHRNSYYYYSRPIYQNIKIFFFKYQNPRILFINKQTPKKSIAQIVLTINLMKIKDNY